MADITRGKQHHSACFLPGLEKTEINDGDCEADIRFLDFIFREENGEKMVQCRLWLLFPKSFSE